MSIQSERQLENLREVGRIVARTLRAVAAQVRPGITTAELDEIGEKEMKRHGARSAPRLVYQFPGALCISVNDEAIHGIPGSRALQPGDLVKIDATAEKDGYYADAAISVQVAPCSPEAARLAACAETAFRKGLDMARTGNRAYHVGRAVERQVRSEGFFVLRELAGHGVGRSIHEEPAIPNYDEPRAKARLTEGLVVTIEPIVAAGTGESTLAKDGWTVKTADRSLAAHFEHTIVITRGAPLLLTVA